MAEFTKGERKVEATLNGEFAVFVDNWLLGIFAKRADAQLDASAPVLYEALRTAQTYITREEIRKGTLSRTRLEEDIIEALALVEGKEV